MEDIEVAGDVQKMLNHILLAIKDQKYHHFVRHCFTLSSSIPYWLWLHLPFGDKPAPDIAMMVVRLLAESTTFSATMGAQVIKDRT
ncbi:hypothetical protein SK128_018648, partial [Halocaridina rubra]